jgi:hypothetical protein
VYTLLRSITSRRLAAQQLVAFMLALGIAEFFYKFKSFLLETAAFLVTWFVIDFVVTHLLGPPDKR